MEAGEAIIRHSYFSIDVYKRQEKYIVVDENSKDTVWWTSDAVSYTHLKKYYLIQILKVGLPAGIQSTVINFSNVLLQSSFNSFGERAMAGYTAANNILGFLYVSVNSVTQACMSFTRQNYGVRKFKSMDKVLANCAILSICLLYTSYS